MIQGLLPFTLREWGTFQGEGHLCGACGSGKYRVDGSRLECPSCSYTVTPGWRRNHYSHTQYTKWLPLEPYGPLYASVQHYVRKPLPDEDNPLHLSDLLFDIDQEHLVDARHTAERLTDWLDSVGAYYQLFYSGSKGFHIEVPWQTVGAAPSERLNHQTYKLMAQQIADGLGIELCMTTYSRRKLFRVANTRHAKTGLFKAWLHRSHLRDDIIERASYPTTINRSGEVYTYDVSAGLHELYLWALEQEPNVSQVSLAVPYEGVSSHPYCVTTALAQGAPRVGTRHTLTLNMASYFVQHGMSQEAFVAWAESTPGHSSTPASIRKKEAGTAYQWALRRRADFRCREMQELDLCDHDCPFYFSD
jgi:hypothetical protein